MKQSLNDQFGNSIQFDENLKEFLLGYKKIMYHSVNENNLKNELSSNRISFTELCTLKIFVTNYLKLSISCLLSAVVLIFLSLLEFKKEKLFNLAENLYKCIKLEIKNNKMVHIVIISDQIF